MDPLILLLGSPLFSNLLPFAFEWAPFPLLLGSTLFSNGHPYVFYWVTFPLLLGSPSLSIGVLFVSDGSLPIRNQMETTWKAQECPIEE